MARCIQSKLTAFVAPLAALLIVFPAAHAQTSKWPDKPVRAIVPFAPGGGTDVVARFIAPKLSETFGQQFFIDNRPGAGGSIGVEMVVRANPDGYTILIGASSYTSNAALYKLPYDPIRGFAPVPLGTPVEIIARLNQGIGRALNLPDIQERLRANGMESGHGTPTAFNQFIADEITKYSRVVKNGNIRVE